MAYTLIASQTLLNPTATVTFSGITQIYKDLVLEVSGSIGAESYLRIRFNNDSNTNYSDTLILGTGSLAQSFRDTNISFMYASVLNTSIGTAIHNIMSYANTNVFKTSINRYGTSSYGSAALVNLWRSTSAINSIEIYLPSTTFNSATTFKLWGIS